MKRVLANTLYIAAIVLILGSIINLYILFSTQDKIYEDIAQLPQTDTAIILGAGVYEDESLSPVLEARVQSAIAVYQNGYAETILISGDNSNTEYNEVIPVRNYLLRAGVPAADIFTDFAGFDTYDSMYRADSVFAVESAIVVTQSFHLPRAVYLGTQLGIETYGYVPSGNRVALGIHMREFAARIKAYLDILTNAEPYFYGRPIPIDGDGRNSLE